jgi:hypothetical protein
MSQKLRVTSQKNFAWRHKKTSRDVIKPLTFLLLCEMRQPDGSTLWLANDTLQETAINS